MIMGLAIAGLVIASCVNPIDQYLKVSNKAVKVTFQAQQVDESGTKTIRNNDKTVSWMPSDKISIICGSDKGMFTSTNTENALLASFTGELTEATVNAINSGTNDPIWALYPYDENVVSDGTSVTTTLPSNQMGVAGTFADDLFISLAKSNDLNLSFFNVCSGFKFSVTKAGITSITIQGKNNEDLAGKVKLSFGLDGKPKVDEVIEGQKTITLTPEKSTFEIGKDYYFVTLPVPFADGFIITFNTPSETGVFDHSSSVSFPRSSFVTKTNVDANVVYGTKVGNINIPDANFKAYCVAKFDTNNDLEISYAEALSVNSINVHTDNIFSLSGIEFFSNLQRLNCSGSSYQYVHEYGRYIGEGKLTELDISNNVLLVSLHVASNRLSSLDVSRNQLLKTLDCDFNSISDLDVRNNTQLTSLDCSWNQIEGIDVSNNLNLIHFVCDYNMIKDIDVSNNTQLLQLGCSSNQLTSINISNNPSLTALGCDFNQLESISISANTLLKSLSCEENQLTSLDVSKNTLLETLSCRGNQLTSLDVSMNSALTILYCDNNQLTSLDVSNTALLFLQCHNNQLTSLDVSMNSALIQLWCDANQLTSLNVSSNTALTDLRCYNNQMMSLDVSKNTALTDLSCGYNQLTSLNVSNNTALTDLRCSGNQLTGIDVSMNSLLIYLDCGANQLTSLNVSNNTALTQLICYANQLTSLEVSNNTVLTQLWCYANQLTSLDVSMNSALTTLVCIDNPYLTEIWLKTGQTISIFGYDTEVATIKYK